MADYPVVLQGVLNRIHHTVKVDIEDFDGEEEWFEIESDDLQDSDLYNRLRLHWNQIVGIHSRVFALLFCQGGTDSGVWVHFFDHAPQEYAPGCHKLLSW
jgi:hypothetical protein